MMHCLFSAGLNISTLVLLWQLTICKGEWTIAITKATNCNISGLKLFLENASAQYHYPSTYLDFRLRVTEDIKALNQYNLHIERCNNQGYDCEDFQNWKFSRFCSVLQWKNQIWSGLVDHIKPPFKCPIKKGFYEAQNSSIDLDAIMNWYPDMENYHWKTDVKIMTERNDVVYCGIMEADFQRSRRQDWRKPFSRKPKHR